MSSYVIFNGSEEKRGQTHPDIVGPFTDHAAAATWLEDNPAVDSWLEFERSCHGGWPTAIIVSADTATDPGQWEADNGDDEDGDDEDDVDPTSHAYLAGVAAAQRADLGDFFERSLEKAQAALARERTAE